ncbi:MAG TPA: HAD-IA family hydrolase, partial [Vicinamibacterales bacterium]|nr:HAD-IA family hydrolase [Vicinamibacterales bacterium]
IFSAAISSAELGFLKPHPAIFEAALAAVGEPAAAAVMVGDSVKADIEGARRIGMRAVLVRRAGDGLSSPLQHVLGPGYEDVPVIASLAELPALLLPDGESRTPVLESRIPNPESRT